MSDDWDDLQKITATLDEAERFVADVTRDLRRREAVDPAYVALLIQAMTAFDDRYLDEVTKTLTGVLTEVRRQGREQHPNP